MKMKKLIAVGAAAAMSMAMCVNVFAESEVKNADKASYATGAATYSETITAKDGTQMTVLVFKKVDTAETVSNANIEYINQDTANASLYAGMKTKNDLLAVGEDGTATYAGDYIIRVGYYDAEGTWRLAQGSFTVDTKAIGTKITLSYGDVNGNDEIEPLDVSLLLQRSIGLVTAFKDTLNRTIPDKVGDVNGNDELEPLDVSLLLQKSIGLVTDFVDSSNNPLTKYTYTVSE